MSKARWWICLLGLLAAVGTSQASGADLKSLHGHVPAAVAHLNPVGRLAATNQMCLAIGLPLRDSAGLDTFLAQLYDPASPNYRHYLTSEEFADRFGPTEQDYEAVKQFARTNGLGVAATYNNRLVLDVTGPATAVEKALHITLHTYQHPTEPRQFFAPDTEPTVDVSLPVADIDGLDNFVRPRPKFHRHDIQLGMPSNGVVKQGTAPDGVSYLGQDLRNAYAPGVTLNGAGQMVGLFQFDGFSSNNIVAYENLLPGQPRVPLKTVLLNGFNGSAGGSEGEVCLDIEMAIGMAPGLSKIILFEGSLQNSILNAMASSNMVKNLSCSWGWGGGPSATTDNIFKTMAAQGQSFFNASGDQDAFAAGSTNDVDNTTQANAPSSSPFITQVGGTVLTMDDNAISFVSETVWNERTVNPNGGDWGSSGGISTYYSITNSPWQTNLSMTAARGSTTKRNIPDVALTADFIYSISGNLSGGQTGGTSCAAPLWAGLMALVNQQATANNRPSAGFINPAIYAIAAGSNYSTCFHDVTTGDNTWSPSSPSLFYATNGYDLCTGLGTPNGGGLITALAKANDTLGVSPTIGYAFSGPFSGPFNPGAGPFQLTNSSTAALSWSLINTSLWLQADFTNGTLPANSATNLNISCAAAASNLAIGSYSATVSFTNLTSHVIQRAFFTLQISQPMSVSPIKGFVAAGPVGGPFVSTSQNFVLTNPGNSTVSWSIINTSAWLTVSATNGFLAGGGSATVTATLLPLANTLAAAVYNTSLVFTNPLGLAVVVPFTLAVGQPIVLNGGFETGDFSDWTQSGNIGTTEVTNGSINYIHSGTYAAQLGPLGAPGYLTQNLPTVAGQDYLLSLWLRNPSGDTPNLFQVQWSGTTLFYQTNITGTGWSNLQFLVTAPSTITPLQFGFQNDPAYFGLDDISVTPLVPVVFKSLVQSVNNFQLTWNTSTGIVYQVQYKTNLLQANWLNLGSATTAKTTTLSMTDTNAFQHSPQRYYRLLAVP